MFLGHALSIPPLSEDRCENLYTSTSTASKHLIIKRGDPLLLNCSLERDIAVSSPKNFLWIKNGQPFISKNIFGRNIVYENGSLHIPSTKSSGNGDNTSDDGIYFCVINYSSKSVLSAPIKVSIAG